MGTHRSFGTYSQRPDSNRRPAVYETDLDVFDMFWNSDRNRTDAMQTMVRTLLTIAGFSVLYRIVW